MNWSKDVFKSIYENDNLPTMWIHTTRVQRPENARILQRPGIGVQSSPASVATLLHFPAVPASVLNPATAARKGGSVAASPVDLSEFGTADERE